MPRPDTYASLYKLAEGQDGYFSSYQAQQAAISRMILIRAAEAGVLERTSRGVYRLTHFPVISNNAHLWEAVLWPQVRKPYLGTLSHYTALQLHDLSNVNPEATHITVPMALRSARRTPPPLLVVHRADLKTYDIMNVDGLPVTTVERTLLDIAQMHDPVALADALRDARARRLPIPRELEHV
jgi:predicted transcriptional regulator of viral defense system